MSSTWSTKNHSWSWRRSTFRVKLVSWIRNITPFMTISHWPRKRQRKLMSRSSMLAVLLRSWKSTWRIRRKLPTSGGIAPRKLKLWSTPSITINQKSNRPKTNSRTWSRKSRGARIRMGLSRPGSTKLWENETTWSSRSSTPTTSGRLTTPSGGPSWWNSTERLWAWPGRWTSSERKRNHWPSRSKRSSRALGSTDSLRFQRRTAATGTSCQQIYR